MPYIIIELTKDSNLLTGDEGPDALHSGVSQTALPPSQLAMPHRPCRQGQVFGLPRPLLGRELRQDQVQHKHCFGQLESYIIGSQSCSPLRPSPLMFQVISLHSPQQLPRGGLLGHGDPIDVSALLKRTMICLLTFSPLNEGNATPSPSSAFRTATSWTRVTSRTSAA